MGGAGIGLVGGTAGHRRRDPHGKLARSLQAVAGADAEIPAILNGNGTLRQCFLGSRSSQIRRIQVLPGEPPGQQEDLKGAAGGRIPCLMSAIIGRVTRLLKSPRRECEEKHRADANLAFDADVAPVSFHDFPRDGEPEPRAALACGRTDASQTEGLK